MARKVRVKLIAKREKKYFLGLRPTKYLVTYKIDDPYDDTEQEFTESVGFQSFWTLVIGSHYYKPMTKIDGVYY